MTNIGLVGARALGANAAPSDAADGTEETYTPTPEEVAFAKEHPAGMVNVERSGLKLATRITGGTLGLGGAALLGISLLSRGGGGPSRLLAAPLLIGGGLVAAGAGAFIGAELIKPQQRIAVATKFATRGDAQQFANKMVGRVSEVVQDEGGTWAVLDKGPIQNTRGYNYGRDTYYGGHNSGYHYYGDGHHHHHPYGYYEPYYPGHYNRDYYPDYNWGGGYDPWDSYPTPSGGYTSPGDDYPSSGGGYNPPSSGGGYDYPSSGGSTSSGDDGGSSSYDPPDYDPPSYDPPSYDPPSYDPPSYDPPSYDPPSYDPPSYGGGSDYGGSYGGDSSSNGNPDYDDF